MKSAYKTILLYEGTTTAGVGVLFVDCNFISGFSEVRSRCYAAYSSAYYVVRFVVPIMRR